MRGKIVGKAVLALIMLLLIGTVDVQAKEIVLRFASGYFPYPHKHAAEEVKGPEVFCDLVNKRGAGKVKVEYYSSGQLFKDKDMMTAIPGGSLDMGCTTMSQWAGLIPEVNIFELPFFYTDEEHLNRVYNSKAGEIINKAFEKKNMKVLGLWKNGPIILFTREKQIKGPDLRGMKVRVFGSSVADFVTSVGAGAIFMSSSEMYLALQRGTVDGVISTTNGMIGGRLYEISKYATVMPNYWTTFPLLMNLDNWNALPEDVKNLLKGAANDVMAMSKKDNWVQNNIKEAFEIVKKNNLTVYEVEGENYKAWKKKTEVVTDKFVSSMGAVGAELVKYAREVGK
jgi:tripartite ATP-independent transporter DctP family solute receptor